LEREKQQEGEQGAAHGLAPFMSMDSSMLVSELGGVIRQSLVTHS